MLNFNPALLLPFFRFVGPTSFSAGAAPVPIAAANSQRVGLLIANGAAGTSIVYPISLAAGAVSGISLQTNNFYMFSYEQFGALVQQPWFLNTGAGGGVWVVEIIFVPSEG